MKFSSMFQEALRQFLFDRDIVVEKVVDFSEETYRVGCCETCSYDRTVVSIGYVTRDGDYDTYDFEGRFVDLVRELSGDDDD